MKVQGFVKGLARLGCVVAALTLTPYSHAGDFVDSCERMYVGDMCKMAINNLEATQFAVGMRIVDRRYEKLLKMSHDELRDYLMDHPVPVVLAPDGRYYMTDRHHQTLAALRVGRENVFAALLHDFSKLPNMTTFWKRMKKKELVYLFDENGKGPHEPADLPKHVRYLKDDPYRSLADDVQAEGGYLKKPVPFQEFYWAQFFRARVKIGSGEDGYWKSVKNAARLAKTSAAVGLPGYAGPRKKGGREDCSARLL